MPDYTPHQKRIIRNYYENRDPIMLARLSEIVSDLYVAERPARKAALWKRARAALEKLGVPAGRIDRMVASGKPEFLAELVKEIF